MAPDVGNAAETKVEQSEPDEPMPVCKEEDWPEFEDSSDDDACVEAIDRCFLDLSGSHSIDGTAHMLHNATEDLRFALVTWKDMVAQMKHVCRLLCRRGPRERLIARCFVPPVAQVFAPDLRAFKGNVIGGRWATVCAAVPELRAVEHELRHYWDLQKYQGASRGKDAEEDNDRDGDT